MGKKCFLSFHFEKDSWRVSQVREIRNIEEQPILAANQWEEIKQKGDTAIERWIDDNLMGRRCLVVLVGENTAGRRWVKHEIKTAWTKGLGILAVHIHNLKDQNEKQSTKGTDPFAGLTVNGVVVKGAVYDPPYQVSTNVYKYISDNLEGWIDTAVAARKK